MSCFSEKLDIVSRVLLRVFGSFRRPFLTVSLSVLPSGFLVVLLSLSLSPLFPLDFITNAKLVSWFNPTATPGNNKVKGGQWEVGGWLGG